MSQSANVLSVQAIDELRTALLRFQGEAQEALQAAAGEVQRTLDWLAERLRFWQGEVRRREELWQRAYRALQQCLACEDCNCAAYYEAERKAKLYLAQAQDEVRTVQGWTRLVQQAAAEYEQQARRLGGLLGTEVPNSTALLRSIADRLSEYVALAAPSAETTPPSAAAAVTGLGAAGLGLAFLSAAEAYPPPQRTLHT